jgi:hypothetical protein
MLTMVLQMLLWRLLRKRLQLKAHKLYIGQHLGEKRPSLELNGQLPVPRALLLGKDHSVFIVLEAPWALKPGCTLDRTEYFLTVPKSRLIQPITCLTLSWANLVTNQLTCWVLSEKVKWRSVHRSAQWSDFASRIGEPERDSSQVSECLWPESFQPKGSVCAVQEI